MRTGVTAVAVLLVAALAGASAWKDLGDGLVVSDHVELGSLGDDDDTYEHSMLSLVWSSLSQIPSFWSKPAVVKIGPISVQGSGGCLSALLWLLTELRCIAPSAVGQTWGLWCFQCAILCTSATGVLLLLFWATFQLFLCVCELAECGSPVGTFPGCSGLDNSWFGYTKPVCAYVRAGPVGVVSLHVRACPGPGPRFLSCPFTSHCTV